MPTNISVENNFIGGLKTEFTGLNFPENACTSATNCVFSIIGDVLSREGIDYEANFALKNIVTDSTAVNYYRWLNAGGDGASQILAVQASGNIYLFLTSAATAASPISAQLLTPVINLSTFLPAGSTANPALQECQFADGNGYLFIFHPNLNPFYVQYIPPPAGPAIQTNVITLQIRDFQGVYPEPGNPSYVTRPTTLTNEHNYNLQNQGWTNANTWSTSSTTANLFSFGNSVSLLPSGGAPTNETFTVASGLTVTLGTQVNISWSAPMAVQSPGDGVYPGTASGTAIGNVTAYSGTSMTINVTSSTIWNPSPGTIAGGPFSQSFAITSSNLINTINTWQSQIGNYPSNSDIWWEYISPNTSAGAPGTFNPSTMISVVPVAQAQAPQGHFLLNPFDQERSAVSGVPSITPIVTTKRPRTGCWFQGRVWYTGVDDSQASTGDMPFYTWTENIYFSQIVSTIQDFGSCYQANDPTDNRLFTLEPDDGGVIVIQGSGPIYKLFPIQNGIIVFAANGVWLVLGNSGLGFTANDYSISKVSSVKSIASTSYVDVLGLPFFWNSEGIYRVAPTEAGAPYHTTGFNVEPLTVGTILGFYNNIPFDSKLYVKGSYDPISYVVSWVYRSTEEAGISNRYKYDSSLNLNVFNRAFYPYTFGNNNLVTVNGIVYMDYPSGSLIPQFKYIVSTATQLTFAEERDNVNWEDWVSSGVAAPYVASFTTGYKVHGQAFRKWQPIYVNVYSNNATPTAYTIQGIWDYANATKTGKISTKQKVFNPITSRTMANGIAWPDTSDFNNIYRRHKIPGHGEVLQLEFTNIAGLPMHLIGWAIPEQINTSA